MRLEDSSLIFDSGREIATNRHDNAIALDFNEPPRAQHYLDDMGGGFLMDFSSLGDFTAAERLELADYMIARWQQFREG